MRQVSTGFWVTGLALAMVAGAALPAAASPRHHHHRAVGYYHRSHSSVGIKKRSWLDPGPVAPAGATGPAYMAQSTIFNQTPDESYFPSGFHEDAMPRPLYVPGSMVPIIRFSTPGGP